MTTKNLRTKGKVGPNIVRAWFNTVLNPLLRALTSESQHLERADWTWRFVPGGLERIRPVRGHLDIDARDNLELFLELHSAVAAFAHVHDKNVMILSDKCRELQQRLEEASELQRVYKRVTSPEALSEIGASLQQVFGAYPPEDHVALLAQYIVNNTGDLPDHYTTARFWNKYKDEFLAILRHRSVYVHAVRTERAGQTLLRSVGLLFRTLKETRLKLSLEHDVPYVSASASNREGML
jgi:hypothetical protein